jgi:hypothetical protein
MRRGIKKTLRIIGVALLLIAILMAFIPLLDEQSQYCIYCGREELNVRILGVPVPLSGAEKNIYQDSINIPDHNHKMIDHYSSRIWAFKGQQSSDEFGWTGRRFRDALIDGIQRTPELEDEIISAYLSLNLDDEEQAKAFLAKYEEKKPNKAEMATPRKPSD